MEETRLDELIEKLQSLRDEYGNAVVRLEVGTARSRGEKIEVEPIDNYGEAVLIYDSLLH